MHVFTGMVNKTAGRVSRRLEHNLFVLFILIFGSKAPKTDHAVHRKREQHRLRVRMHAGFFHDGMHYFILIGFERKNIYYFLFVTD